MLFRISLDLDLLTHVTFNWTILVSLNLSSGFWSLGSPSRIIRLTVILIKLFGLGYHLSHDSLLSESFNLLVVGWLFIVDTVSYFNRFFKFFISTFWVLLLSAVLILIDQWRSQITAFLRIVSDEVDKDLRVISSFSPRCRHSADLNCNILWIFTTPGHQGSTPKIIIIIINIHEL